MDPRYASGCRIRAYSRDWANKPIFDTEEELVKARKKGTRWNELGTLMTGVRLRTLGVADIRRRWIERWDGAPVAGTVRDARHEGN